jgi:hypothetical protein
MARAPIPEHLMHRIWKDPAKYLIDQPILADGTPLTIVNSGHYNDHRGGPDFLNAELSLQGLSITGDVELHTSLDEWSAHGHDGDQRYSSVILHVVLTCEDELGESHAPHLPTLALADNLRLNERSLWEQLFDSVYSRSPELACFPHNLQVPIKFKRKVIGRFAESRLDELCVRFSDETESTSQFLDRVYLYTLDALGYSENRTAFKQLAEICSIQKLKKLRTITTDANRSITFQALFFGCSGLLAKTSADFSSSANEKILELAAAWAWIESELDLAPPLTEGDWAFFRIRPLNSPHRRVALAAHLAEHLFSSDHPVDLVLRSLSDLDVPVGVDPFWEHHTSFASEIDEAQSLLGDERKRALGLNVALPAQIAYTSKFGEGKLLQMNQAEVKALRDRWMTSRTRSSAHYINVVRQELLESESVKTVREEQGALLLTRSFCQERRCNECPIGQKLMLKGWNAPIGTVHPIVTVR